MDFESLTQEQQELLGATLQAHYACTFRDNPSTLAFQLAFEGSSSFSQAVSAALCSFGGGHAPLLQTYELLASESPNFQAMAMLDRGEKVPGWGTSFKNDDSWNRVQSIISRDFPQWSEVLSSVTKVLNDNGKPIQPNPSAYTVVTALVIGLPKEMVSWIIIQGRLGAWLTLGNQVIKGGT